MNERLNLSQAEIQVDSQEEFLDIVDDQDNVIGRLPRSEIELTEFKNVRSVAGFLINSEGHVWIPRRTAGKKLFPLGLDMSFAGYARSGENYLDAAKREMKEELHIDPEKVEFKKLGKLSPHKDGVSSFMTVYLIKTDETPRYNPDDFSEGSWLEVDKLIQKLKEGETAKSDLLKVVERFLSDFIVS